MQGFKDEQMTSFNIIALLMLILVIPILLVSYIWISVLLVVKILELFDDWI